MGRYGIGGVPAIALPVLMAAAWGGGAGAATVTVEGSVRFGPESTLTIELGSLAPGQYDRMEIQGTLQAGGTLVVILLPGFAVGPGDDWEILTADAIAGAFAYTPPDVGAGLTLALRQEATAIRLVAAADCNGNRIPDADEIDQGLVQDCDGNLVPDGCDLAGGAGDANANGFLDACEVSTLSVTRIGLSWTALVIADVYDVIAGDLTALRATGGDFAAATRACLADDQPGTALGHAIDPLPDGGMWFLVRGAAGPAGLSLDTFAPGQAGSRDAEVGASAEACP